MSENIIQKQKAEIDARTKALNIAGFELQIRFSDQDNRLKELSNAYKFLNLYNHNEDEIIDPVPEEIFIEKINILINSLNETKVNGVESTNIHEKRISEIFYLIAARLLTIKNSLEDLWKYKELYQAEENKLGFVYKKLKDIPTNPLWKKEVNKLLKIHQELLNKQILLLDNEEHLQSQMSNIYKTREDIYNHAIHLFEQ